MKLRRAKQEVARDKCGRPLGESRPRANPVLGRGGVGGRDRTCEFLFKPPPQRHVLGAARGRVVHRDVAVAIADRGSPRAAQTFGSDCDCRFTKW